MVDIFISKVIEKDQLQKKYLQKSNLINRKEFLQVLMFLNQKYNGEGCEIDYIVDSYLFLNNMIKEETYYFVKNNKYRYDTYNEVNNIVYSQKEYMEKYMIGLLVSQYIWSNHIGMIEYFKSNSFSRQIS